MDTKYLKCSNTFLAGCKQKKKNMLLQKQYTLHLFYSLLLIYLLSNYKKESKMSFSAPFIRINFIYFINKSNFYEWNKVVSFVLNKFNQIQDYFHLFWVEMNCMVGLSLLHRFFCLIVLSRCTFYLISYYNVKVHCVNCVL